MSQIEKKNQEFVKTNAAALDKKNNQEFGYWKSLKDISSEDDYNRFLKQSEHNVDNGLSRRNFLSLVSFRSMVYNLRLKHQIQELIKIINPKLIITAAERGTIANTPHKIRLKKIDARMPITNSDAKILINDDRTIKMTRSLNTTIMPVTSILDSLLKFFSMCSFNWFVYEKI